jgi:hypothetical protein
MSRALFVATPLPEALAEEGREAVDFLREDHPTKEKAGRAFAFIYGVGEYSLEYHFREPLGRLGVGLVMRRALGVALDVALRGLRPPLRKVLEGMDDTQLRAVADEIEVRLYPDPHGQS